MKLDYVNIGCGSKYHKQWVNIDMVAKAPEVIEHNILEGLPFPNETFQVAYHSQVLEHIPKNDAFDFMSECYRVIKKDGILRVVVPDLENIVVEYIRLLQENITSPSLEAEANYDWILLELFDQMVRNFSGGEMAKYLMQHDIPNEKYVLGRTGLVGHLIRRAARNLNRNLSGKLSNDRRTYSENEIGKFRLGGEVHMWMYDRFSLTRLLRSVGFKEIEVKDPFSSNIRNWGSYYLDSRDGFVFDPTSLFMEARK